MLKRTKKNSLTITLEEKERWESFLHSTWYAIGSDVKFAFKQSGDKLTRDCIIEMTLDANRLLMYSDITKEEERVLCEAAYGYGRFNRVPPGFKKWLKETLNY